VIIPVGRPDRVRGTLEALARQQPPPDDWEVILVGTSLGEARLEGLNLPLRQVPLPDRAAPGATRAAGVAGARGDWYVFLDDDIEPDPDFLRRAGILCAGYADSPERLGALGARLPGKSGRFWEGVTDVSNFWSQQGAEAAPRDWLYSAALLVSAGAYREAGGFDPALPVGEDVDLTRRIAARGFALRYEPSLIARHDHRRDTPAAMWRYFWRNGEGAKYFFRAIGGTCPFSLKTVWLKTWTDFRLNRDPGRGRPAAHGWRAPLVWLNYLIVETSLEWHWQLHLREGGRHRTLTARTAADRTAARALALFDEGRRWSGLGLYVRAMIEDFANPVRR
jgi:glycosyltransferase involved in cell wall biosynthesis